MRRRHGKSRAFVLVDLVAQRSDGNLEITSRTSAGATVKGERPQNELALNVFDRVTDKPRNNQSVELTGECRAGHTLLPEALRVQSGGSDMSYVSPPPHETVRRYN